MTVVDYSTFIAQVKAGNVMAVTIRDKEVNGLLAKPLQKGQAGVSAQPTITPNQRAADFAASSHYLGTGSNWANASANTTIDPSRLVYTQIPAGGDTALTSSLLINNISLHTIT